MVCNSENGGRDGGIGKAKSMGRTRLPIPCPALPDSRSPKAGSILDSRTHVAAFPGPLADKFG